MHVCDCGSSLCAFIQVNWNWRTVGAVMNAFIYSAPSETAAEDVLRASAIARDKVQELAE